MIDAAATKDINIQGGQVDLVSKDNTASAISLTTDIGSSETIVITNTQGTSSSAVDINANAGGVTIDAGTPLADATIVPFGPLCVDSTPIVLDAVTIGDFTGYGVVGGMFDPAIAGIGTHTITNTIATGCGGLSTYNIIVNPLPSVSFSANKNSGCQPLEIIFTNTGDFGEGCEWNFGDGSISSLCGGVTHTYYNSGIYDVELTVTDVNGCSSTVLYEDYIDVFVKPVADFTFDPSTTTTEETLITFTDLSSNAEEWTWTFDDHGNSNDQNPIFTFPQLDGSYDITLIVKTDKGCSDSITKTLIITQEQLIYAPNVITPDGDSFNEIFLPYLTGIDIYDYHLAIYNRWGEVVFESYDVTKGWNGTYGGEIVEDGVYIWQIEFGNVNNDIQHLEKGTVTLLK